MSDGLLYKNEVVKDVKMTIKSNVAIEITLILKWFILRFCGRGYVRGTVLESKYKFSIKILFFIVC